MKLSIATWNINSVRLRLDQIARFVDAHGPDILCLQEIKCDNESFPCQRLEALGFRHLQYHGQKAYHGVATLSRLPITRHETRDFDGTGERRHLAVRLEPGRDYAPLMVHNLYVPAGGDLPDPGVNPKFRQKLAFLQAMADWRADRVAAKKRRMILVGDLNVAPLETDVWSHRQLRNVVSHTAIEIEHLARARRSHAWVDVMREHVPPEEKLFTWWSYRARDWRASNRGRRLDHVWATPALADQALGLQVIDETRDWPQPSDHAPVLATFDLAKR